MIATPSGSKPPRGTRDLLPPHSERLALLERRAGDILERAGYGRIVTPVFEATEVFTRGIGEATDIVMKEMYTFEDRSGNSLTLRPEGTAPVVRAIVGGRLWNRAVPVKLWYSAPMFRYERPQKGRWRQHHQIGIEAVGSDDPALDAEVIEAGWRILQDAAVGGVTLLLNSMGHPGCRAAYLPALQEFLELHREHLDADCRRRMGSNPLRVFDCKVPKDAEILATAPTLDHFICEACREHLGAVEGFLKEAGIEYRMEPRLVRGFDYYTRTTFEYQSAVLQAAQNAVGGGGRYDGLVEELGGPSLPGIGFGLGADRILIAQEAAGTAWSPPGPDCVVVPLGPEDRSLAVGLVRDLRNAGLRADVAYGRRSLKAALKQADRLAARFTALIGATERESGTATMRDMTTGDQEPVAVVNVPAWLTERSR